MIFVCFRLGLVCRMRVETGELSGVAASDLAAFYIGGRAVGTYSTYSVAFKRVWEHGRTIGRSVFRWGEGEVAGLLVEAGKVGASENAIKQLMAVVNLLFEVMGCESPTKGDFVSQVKKGALKMRAPVVKRSREMLRVQDMKGIITDLYRTPASQVAAEERRCLTLQVFLFFGMRRFSDVCQVKVGDLKFLKSGDVEVSVGKTKTDQLGLGFTFTMSGKKKSGISIPEMIRWYLASLGLRDCDYLFPRLRGSREGVVAVGDKAVAYSTALADLKVVTKRLGMPGITLHSGRVGAATEGVAANVGRDRIRICGGWSSSSMDVYVKPNDSGIAFSNAMVDRF